jgi:hypothetical protein
MDAEQRAVDSRQVGVDSTAVEISVWANGARYRRVAVKIRDIAIDFAKVASKSIVGSTRFVRRAVRSSDVEVVSIHVALETFNVGVDFRSGAIGS